MMVLFVEGSLRPRRRSLHVPGSDNFSRYIPGVIMKRFIGFSMLSYGN